MTTIEEFSRSGRAGRRVLRVAAWMLSSVLAAMIGPFGTFTAMSFEERLFYWGGLIGVALLVAVYVRKGVLAYMGDSLNADISGAVAIAATLGPSICLFNALILGVEVLSLGMMLQHILVVLVVSLGMVLIRLYARIAFASAPPEVGVAPAVPDSGAASVDARAEDADDLGSESAQELPAFLTHVEEEIGRDLRWIAADDHYLRVHTEAGSARVLMRFRDALKELSHLPGLQVHRSHWVAIAAVVTVRPEGRRHVAVLRCGAQVPVSRSHLPDLRAAGLLSDDGA
ncbi:MAG: transcriptional regulator, LytTR family [Rhodobacteraceae bacterium HLUCCO18]|nr:MAG: transcriptional regulator, LytTR family [Rhodobacteraceae bacterium HLUCCO18]